MSEIGNGDRLHDRTDVLDTTEEVCSPTASAPSIDPIEFVEVPLDERLADNPLSARHSLGELDGLEASIRTRGLLQPLIVARAEVFLLACPEASVDVEAEWILLAGHRRRAAACRAGIKTAIAIVRDDLVGSEDSAAVTLVENVHRAGLSSIDEARVLSVLRDLGLSQREISHQTGISQGQVSKRLQLLDLPTELQDSIDDGHLAVADALTMLHELSDPQDQLRALRLSQGGGRSLKHVLRQLQRDQAARYAVADQLPDQDDKGMEKADHGNANVLSEGPRSEVYAAIAVVEDKLAHKAKGTGIGESQEGLKLHAAACSARIEACRRAVQSRLTAEQIADVLVDATLDPPSLRSANASDQAQSMAAEWTATIFPKGLDVSAPYNVLRGTRDAAQRLAVAIVLARREIDLVSADRFIQPWHEAACRHVRRLAAWGVHIPTAYEHAKLANKGSDRSSPT